MYKLIKRKKYLFLLCIFMVILFLTVKQGFGTISVTNILKKWSFNSNIKIQHTGDNASIPTFETYNLTIDIKQTQNYTEKYEFFIKINNNNISKEDIINYHKSNNRSRIGGEFKTKTLNYKNVTSKLPSVKFYSKMSPKEFENKSRHIQINTKKTPKEIGSRQSIPTNINNIQKEIISESKQIENDSKSKLTESDNKNTPTEFRSKSKQITINAKPTQRTLNIKNKNTPIPSANKNEPIKFKSELKKTKTEFKEVQTKIVKPFKPRQLVHFDLKGAPPKVEYFKQVMKYAKQFGADGFLFEYEDMFPWSGELSILKSKYAYSRNDLNSILKYAEQLQMPVIPLVQTFGHMEFVLKHKKYEHLQVNSYDVRSISPMHDETLPLVKSMIDQILDFHKNINWIHLGGDEVYELGRCYGCPEAGKSPKYLYQYHMIPVLKHTSSKLNINGDYIKPIIWDDMLRSWSITDLKRLSTLATLMVWYYNPDVETHLRSSMWQRYGASFNSIWLASAFKGANGEAANFVNINDRLANHKAWIKRAKTLDSQRTVVNGVVLTGWSRFSHKQPLCETLPASIPSLALCLYAGRSEQSNSEINSIVSKQLGFSKPISLYLDGGVNNGSFIGNDAYFLSTTVAQNIFISKKLKTILYPINIRARDIVPIENMEELLKEGSSIVKGSYNILSKYFYNDTIHEFINSKNDNIDDLLNRAGVKLEKFYEDEKIRNNPLTKRLTDSDIQNLKPFQPRQLVHFDLKGAPPKVEYFKQVMDYAKQFGADGFLFEYEDMFPWSGELSILKSKYAYSRNDLNSILNYAKQLHMPVIPLVQTFGHMEFVLKHNKFKHLQINLNDVRSISPMHNESLLLAKSMIDQILDFHKNINWIHVGGDEVYNLGRCHRCPESGISDKVLYQYHMIPVLKYASSKMNSKGVHIKPIIWDDMLRSWSIKDLKTISNLATPMVWKYVPKIEHEFQPEIWYKYNATFSSFWFASAFKGANGDADNFVNIKDRLANHKAWMKRARYSNNYGMKVNGVVLTGWSRFSHKQPLCETLPASIPSLALCLSAGRSDQSITTINGIVSKQLGFSKPISLSLVADIYNGSFIGNDAYFLSAIAAETGFIRTQLETFLSKVNIRASDAKNVQYMIEILKEESAIVKGGYSILSKYFYEDTVKEFITSKSGNIDGLLKEIATKLERFYEYQKILVNPLAKQLQASDFKNLKPFKPTQLVHFDLKGAPPKVEYFKQVMKYAKQFGADGFLIEYEDMFPWSGELSILKSKYAYSRNDLNSILKYAEQLHMPVIPLVQTFGHMEFVLKHRKFKHLQINSNDVRSISPMHNDSLPLVKSMIDQILDFHKNINWIHLGGDEVYNLGRCHSCPESGISPKVLYQYHMIPVLKYASSKMNSKGNHMKPIIWDDMLRSWSITDLKTISSLTTPMVWKYVPDIENEFQPEMWYRYNATFSSFWFASAFKGANGDAANFVSIKPRLANHNSWMKRARYSNNYGMKVNGVVLTGWSRFSHKQPLCETLPASIPSLALCLSTGRPEQSPEKIIKFVKTELGFSESTDFELHFILPNATFPGNEVYRLSMIIDGIKMLSYSVTKILNVKNPSKEIFQNVRSIVKVLNQYTAFLADASNSISKYLYEDSIKEFVETKIQKILPFIKTSKSNLNKFIQRESGVTNRFSQTINKDINPYNQKTINSKTSRFNPKLVKTNISNRKPIKTKASLSDQKPVKSISNISKANPVLNYVASNLNNIEQSVRNFKRKSDVARTNDRLEKSSYNP